MPRRHATETFRDRIQELRRVRAGDLLPHPANWRKHPKSQQDALRGVLREIGFADALLARDTPSGIQLIDGHLRANLDPDLTVPVLILDLSDAEADKLLATLDPIAAMARPDQDKLLPLLESIAFEDAAVNAMLEALANGETAPLPDPASEWQGMPEFHQEDKEGLKCIVHFETNEDMRAFEELVGQKIPSNTKAIWYPYKKWADMQSTVYKAEDDGA